MARPPADPSCQGEFNDDQPQEFPDLRRGQPNAQVGVHGGEHVVDQRLDFRRDAGNRLRDLPKHGIGEFENSTEHDAMLAAARPGADQSDLRVLAAFPHSGRHDGRC